MHASPARALRSVVAPRCAHVVLCSFPPRPLSLQAACGPVRHPKARASAARAFGNPWLRKRSFCESASCQLEIARPVPAIRVEHNLNRSTTVDKSACVPTGTRGNTRGSWEPDLDLRVCCDRQGPSAGLPWSTTSCCLSLLRHGLAHCGDVKGSRRIRHPCWH